MKSISWLVPAVSVFLPFGVWAHTNAELMELAEGSLRSLGSRGIVRSEFVDQLLKEYLPRHASYFGEMVWVLMVLEQWLARPAARVGTQSA